MTGTAAIPVAEMFATIQGEGTNAGVPAVFLRTAYCNLTCPGWGDVAAPSGCDTSPVWTRVDFWATPEDLIERWRERGWLNRLGRGDMLVLTGGEPLMWQARLLPLTARLRESHPGLRIEVETNCTITPGARFDSMVSQYNCSPKLASAGNNVRRAHRPEVISDFARDERAYFKFVVQEPGRDVAEILDTYVSGFGLAPGRIQLMPQSSSRQELLRNAPAVAAAAIEHGFRFSSRLQLILWDQATGV